MANEDKKDFNAMLHDSKDMPKFQTITDPVSYTHLDVYKRQVFDMERYMKKQRAVVKPTDTFDVYEIDATT